MAETQAPPRRGSLFQAFLMIAALAASCAVGAYYLYSAGQGSSRMAATGFDVARVDAAAPAVSYAAPAAPKASPMPIAGMPGMTTAAQSAAQQDNPMFQKNAGSVAGGAPSSSGPSDADRAREKEFLAKHGAELNAYQARVLDNIAMRHFRSDPVVRRVDAEFARLPGYMKIKRRYEKDHDPFSFARDAIALPEVKNEIAKCLSDPGVWKAAVTMISEALKNPPPSSVYNEAKHFMTSDQSVTGYMADEFMPAAQQNAAAMQGALTTPGVDVGGLQKLASDIAPAGSMPAMPAGMSPAALGAMAGQQPPKR